MRKKRAPALIQRKRLARVRRTAAAKYQQMAQELTFYKALIDALPNPIFAKCSELRFVFFNRAYEVFFDMKREDWLGKTVLDLPYLPEADRYCYQAEDERMLNETKTVCHTLEYDAPDGNGKISTLYWSRGFYDNSTGTKGVVGTIVDISRQKALERELKQNLQALKSVHQQMEKISLTDELTGLANRRYFSNYLHQTIAFYQHSSQPFSVLLIDIDHFKAINDTYGHDVGDRVLQEFSDHLKTVVRKDDVVARIGGEEFVCAMPKTKIDIAEQTAQRLCRSLHRPQTFLRGPAVSCSIGVAEYASNEGYDALLKRADQALYRAKRNGRDQASR